jgi:hypothetical protein
MSKICTIVINVIFLLTTNGERDMTHLEKIADMVMDVVRILIHLVMSAVVLLVLLGIIFHEKGGFYEKFDPIVGINKLVDVFMSNGFVGLLALVLVVGFATCACCKDCKKCD